MRDPKEGLRDIVEAIAAIERYLDRDRAAFEHDELLQTWFLRHLQINGKAARALPDEVRAKAAELCKIGPYQATRLLDRLVKDGRLLRHGERKGAWYERGQKI